MRPVKFLLLGLVPLALSGCIESGKTGTSKLAGDARDCASPDTIAQLKSLLFENAAEQAGPQDRLIVPNLGAQSTLSLDIPVLDEINRDTGKVTCSGRLQLKFPATAASIFGGETAAKLDISYSIQPTADKSANVYTLFGADPLIAAIANANLQAWAAIKATAEPDNSSSSAGAASEAPPPVPPYNPLEELQSDPSLSARNARIQSLFANAQDRDATGQVSEEHRRALQTLAQCENRSCVETWMARRAAALSQWEQ